MVRSIQQLVNSLNKNKTYLMLANILLVFFLILLNNLKVIPLGIGDFIFFAFLVLTFALYRPGWVFLLFCGTIILENINLAPQNFGIAIRPYQFFGALIISALFIRFLVKRLFFKLPQWKWHDYLVLILVFASFLSLLNAPDKINSLRLAFVVVSFALLYFLSRIYIQSTEDLKKVIPFFLSSSVVIVFYGIWQNIRFKYNLSNFEAMSGRPNATFTEPDWLGVYLVLLMSAIYVLIYFRNSELRQKRSEESAKNYYQQQHRVDPSYGSSRPQDDDFRLSRSQNDDCRFLAVFLYIVLTALYVLLILTVSRSAWLGALAVTFIFLFTIWTNLRFRGWNWKETINIKLKILASFMIAVGIVYIFHLTNFQLFNRAASAGTGLQKITISCEKEVALPEKINNINELENYSCRHINLEEIEKEKAAGNFITETYRQDPNINTRKVIYQKSWEQIKNHWFLGIGWGSINQILGRDERGTPLNSSNIFLEAWLGAGLLGLLALVILLIYVFINVIKLYFWNEGGFVKALGLFFLISWFGLIIGNLFNAGILLGIFWVWLGIATLPQNKTV